jgi:uncharacterized membrane protein
MVPIHIQIGNVKRILLEHWISFIAFFVGLTSIIAMCGTWHQTAYYQSSSNDIIKKITTENFASNTDDVIIEANKIPDNTDHLVVQYKNGYAPGNVTSNISFQNLQDEKNTTRVTVGFQPDAQNVFIIELSLRNTGDSILIPKSDLNIDGIQYIEFHSQPTKFSYLNDDFHWRKFVVAFIFLLLASIFLDWLLRTFRYKRDLNEGKIYRSLPYVFLIIVMTLGLTMILKYPIARVELDLDSHYKAALSDSYMGDVRLTIPETAIGFQNNIPAVSHIKSENKSYILAINSLPNISIMSYNGELSASRLPAGMGIALGRMFGAKFSIQFTLGKIFNLVFYALICFWALWYLKSGRFILMVLMLMPGNIFMATSYQYDFWVLSFIYLGLSFFVGTCQRSKKVSAVQIVFITLVLIIAVIPKPLYAPIILIPILLRKNKYDKFSKIFKAWLIPLALGIIVVIARAIKELSQGGDVRVVQNMQIGGTVDAHGQIQFLLSNPSKIWFLIQYAFRYMSSLGVIRISVDSWHYLGEIRVDWLFGILGVLFILLIIVDRDICDIKAFSWMLRVYGIVLYIGLSIAIIVAFYIICTPIGANDVLGLQPRYLLPLYYPLCVMLTPGHRKWKVREATGCATLGVEVSLIIYGIATLL